MDLIFIFGILIAWIPFLISAYAREEYASRNTGLRITPTYYTHTHSNPSTLRKVIYISFLYLFQRELNKSKCMELAWIPSQEDKDVEVYEEYGENLRMERGEDWGYNKQGKQWHSCLIHKSVSPLSQPAAFLLQDLCHVLWLKYLWASLHMVQSQASWRELLKPSASLETPQHTCQTHNTASPPRPGI